MASANCHTVQVTTSAVTAKAIFHNAHNAVMQKGMVTAVVIGLDVVGAALVVALVSQLPGECGVYSWLVVGRAAQTSAQFDGALALDPGCHIVTG